MGWDHGRTPRYSYNSERAAKGHDSGDAQAITICFSSASAQYGELDCHPSPRYRFPLQGARAACRPCEEDRLPLPLAAAESFLVAEARGGVPCVLGTTMKKSTRCGSGTVHRVQ